MWFVGSSVGLCSSRGADGDAYSDQRGAAARSVCESSSVDVAAFLVAPENRYRVFAQSAGKNRTRCLSHQKTIKYTQPIKADNTKDVCLK